MKPSVENICKVSQKETQGFPDKQVEGLEKHCNVKRADSWGGEKGLEVACSRDTAMSQQER